MTQATALPQTILDWNGDDLTSIRPELEEYVTRALQNDDPFKIIDIEEHALYQLQEALMSRGSDMDYQCDPLEGKNWILGTDEYGRVAYLNAKCDLCWDSRPTFISPRTIELLMKQNKPDEVIRRYRAHLQLIIDVNFDVDEGVAEVKKGLAQEGIDLDCTDIAEIEEIVNDHYELFAGWWGTI